MLRNSEDVDKNKKRRLTCIICFLSIKNKKKETQSLTKNIIKMGEKISRVLFDFFIPAAKNVNFKKHWSKIAITVE